MSQEFKCIRRAYLFDLLPDEEQSKLILYVNSIFHDKFLKLIAILRKKYRVDKMDFFLKSFFMNLKAQFEKTRCYVETHQALSNQELDKIEEAIKERFNMDNVLFKYSVDANLLFGLSFRLNYKMYDLSLKSMLKKAQQRVIEKIEKDEGL